MEQTSSDFHSNNQDNFGFLVFDKEKIDTFFKNYKPLKFTNIKLKDSFNNLQGLNTTSNSLSIKFLKHTEPPTVNNYNLAKNVLKTTNDKNGEKYFSESVIYFFFYKCLPDEFHNKWTQTTLGDFKFNVTFFNLLRTQCQVFDNHIYGKNGHWDKDIQTVFKHKIFNEITADKAQLIKNCIIKNKAFNDSNFESDKDNFIFFLDQVIQNKWRLLLVDNN